MGVTMSEVVSRIITNGVYVITTRKRKNQWYDYSMGIKGFFSEWGYEVFFYKTAKDSLEALKKRTFDNSIYSWLTLLCLKLTVSSL